MDPVYRVGAYGDLSNMVHAGIMDRARACFARTEQEKAALGAGFDRLCLCAVPPRIADFGTTWTLSPPEAYTIPGVLRMGDVADFAAASGARVLTVDEGTDRIAANAAIVEFWG